MHRRGCQVGRVMGEFCAGVLTLALVLSVVVAHRHDPELGRVRRAAAHIPKSKGERKWRS